MFRLQLYPLCPPVYSIITLLDFISNVTEKYNIYTFMLKILILLYALRRCERILSLPR